MPSEFDDKQVLLVSGIGVGLYAAHHLLAPRHAHDSYMEASVPFCEPMHRYAGLGMAGCAAACLATAAAEGSVPASKNMLKVAGATWLAGAAMNTYYASQTNVAAKRAFALYATATVNAAVAAMCLWAGLRV